MEKTNEKKVLVLSFLGVITLIAVVVGATYAYFTAQSGGTGNIDTDVITGTTDNLSFSFGDVINIYATEENFGQGMGSISDSTTGRAVLKANNTTNEATATYNIYLIIEANDFVYTTENQTPEILLNVTDPNGNNVENITGLVHYENGFDITTRTGGFLLVPDYEISATDVQTIQDWNIEVTLVNLDSDQNANTNKTLTGRLYLTQEQMSSYELTEINDIDAITTYNTIDATLDLTNGSAAVSKYYYGIEKTSEALAYNDSGSLKRLSNTLASANDVEYIESDDPNYKFSNLEANTEYTIYSYVVDENKIKSNVYETNVTTAEYQIPTVDTVGHSVTLNSISLTVNASNGSNEIVKYMYSKDNGLSWEESTSNTYTFNGLTDSTQYNIKVKVVDSEGVESTEYYEAITTEIYILPVVASVNATTTWNSITLTPTGTNGTNTIDHYEYSINNGAYQTSNVFSNLTDNTEYTIRVKAIDSIGRESNVYSLQVRTDTYVLPTINNLSLSSTSDSITINVSASGGDGSITRYYYSINDGSTYTQSSNNSYTFNNLTDGTKYYIKVYVIDSNGRTSSIRNGSVETEPSTFANYITKKLYNGVDGNNGIYYHDGTGTYGSLEAGDYSYRYSGANPNNYVCFGATGTACQNAENQYRIIGVFNGQVKLIKSTSYGNYAWDAGKNNTWNASTKPDIYTTLNTTFYNTISTQWKNLIESTTWQVGGMDFSETNNSKEYYNYEIGIYQNGYEETMPIGLMYVSDYGYAVTPNYWNTPLFEHTSSEINASNWMYLGDWEHTISRMANETDANFGVYSGGGFYAVFITSSADQIRPSFYLKSSVETVSGTGTQADPYILKIN